MDIYDLVKVELLDTVTGEHVTVDDISIRAWTEGNWSCDCNRQNYFNHNTYNSFCLGCNRYLVVKVDPMPDDYNLKEFNSYYPPEFVVKYCNTKLPLAKD